MPETWGLLPKAQDDNQTIDEAIAAAISDHEADPEAHQGAGESLETHRQSETIDHQAQSVVPDKLIDNFPLIGNVLPCFYTLDPFYYSAYSSYVTLMSIMFRTSTVLDNIAYLALSAAYFTEAYLGDNPWLILPLRLYATGTHDIYFGIGDNNLDYGYLLAGFRITGGRIYAATCDGNNANRTETDVGAFSSGDFHTYKIVLTSGEKCEFYIDGTLVATITTNLPPDDPGFMMFIKLKNTQATKYVTAYVAPFTFYTGQYQG